MKRLSFQVCLSLILILNKGYTNAQKPISFIPIDSLDIIYTWSGDTTNTKVQHFLVENYTPSPEVLKHIDEYANTKGASFGKYQQYVLIFYKDSERINRHNLNKRPKIIIREAEEEDMILRYDWVFGKFLGRQRLIRGALQDDDPIMIEDNRIHNR